MRAWKIKENRICVDFTVSATFPAYSNFNAIVVKNCPNKLNTPPSRSIKMSVLFFGKRQSSKTRDIIVDDRKPNIAKHVIGIVAWRSGIKKFCIASKAIKGSSYHDDELKSIHTF